MSKFLNISVDSTLGGNSPSDEVVSSQKALKTYIDTQATVADMTGATSGAAGTHGLVPAPAAGDQDKVLHGDGTWKVGVGIHPDLFDHKWSDYELSDANWLRADTFSWQAGTAYEVAYNHLVNDYDSGAVSSFWFNDGAETLRGNRSAGNDTTHGGVNYYAWTNSTTGIIYTTSKKPSVGDTVYNSSFVSSYTIDSLVSGARTETISGTTVTYYLATDGHKICLPDQESNVAAIYTATGVAWYYILDTTNQRFKLPRTKFGFTGLRDTVGNYVAPALPNHTHDVAYRDAGTTGGQLNGVGAGSVYFGDRTVTSTGASDSTYQNGATVQPPATQMYLYFYVGNFTQTALENTAGLNASLFNGKADLDFGNTTMIDYVVAKQDPTSGNNYTWYRKYNSGWVEQGGFSSGDPRTATLPIAMADTNYSVLVVQRDTTGPTMAEGSPRAGAISTTQIYVNGGAAYNSVCWQVSGKSA